LDTGHIGVKLIKFSDKGKNLMDADNQQERPTTVGILRDCMPDASKAKIQSDPGSDVRRSAEMLTRLSL
jgi:hypothetical protein